MSRRQDNALIFFYFFFLSTRRLTKSKEIHGLENTCSFSVISQCIGCYRQLPLLCQSGKPGWFQYWRGSLDPISPLLTDVGSSPFYKGHHVRRPVHNAGVSGGYSRGTVLCPNYWNGLYRTCSVTGMEGHRVTLYWYFEIQMKVHCTLFIYQRTGPCNLVIVVLKENLGKFYAHGTVIRF